MNESATVGDFHRPPPGPPQPSIGRIVHYKLSQQDADMINRRRDDYLEARRAKADWPSGAQAHVGNRVMEGIEYPAVVVSAFGPTPGYEGHVNLKVFLDGNDDYWATSRHEGADPGEWHWPDRGTKGTEMADAADLASTEGVEDESGDATDAPEYWKPELLPPEVAALGREAVARLREALRGKTFQNFDVDVAKAVLAEYGAHYLVRCYAEMGED